ncbi:MAG TPA: XRE family transcriptional regulator [Pirellulaceae bacterium]|nr:XRE family transcriptional regulator [Pirellulaceae bacterium]
MRAPSLLRPAGQMQQQLADLLGISQPCLSKMESQDDMQISTLSRLVESLGGRLELIAHMPKGDVRITQFGNQTA